AGGPRLSSDRMLVKFSYRLHQKDLDEPRVDLINTLQIDPTDSSKVEAWYELDGKRSAYFRAHVADVDRINTEIPDAAHVIFTAVVYELARRIRGEGGTC